LTKKLGMCPVVVGAIGGEGFDATSVRISSLPLSKGCSVARVRVMRMGLQERLPYEAKHAVGQTSVVAP
jgi:hypothetical protein